MKTARFMGGSLSTVSILAYSALHAESLMPNRNFEASTALLKFTKNTLNLRTNSGTCSPNYAFRSPISCRNA